MGISLNAEEIEFLAGQIAASRGYRRTRYEKHGFTSRKQGRESRDSDDSAERMRLARIQKAQMELSLNSLLGGNGVSSGVPQMMKLIKQVAEAGVKYEEA